MFISSPQLFHLGSALRGGSRGVAGARTQLHWCQQWAQRAFFSWKWSFTCEQQALTHEWRALEQRTLVLAHEAPHLQTIRSQVDWGPSIVNDLCILHQTVHFFLFYYDYIILMSKTWLNILYEDGFRLLSIHSYIPF